MLIKENQAFIKSLYINQLPEILPLVQFYPEIDISDTEAERLLLAPPKASEDQDPFNEVYMSIFL